MPPTSSSYDMINGCDTDTENGSYFSPSISAPVKPLNFNHIALCQFGISMLRAFENFIGRIYAFGVSPFFHSVFIVALNSAKPKMRRIHTFWIIASVTNPFTAVLSKVNQIRCAVRVKTSAIHPESAVVGAKSRPDPASRFQLWIFNGVRKRTLFIYFFPESLFEGLVALVECVHRTKIHPALRKCYRHIESRNRKTGWKEFWTQCFYGGNSADDFFSLNSTTVN